MQGNEKENLLRIYYQSLFPVYDIMRWLRYVKTREFSFTLMNEIYIRYITVNTAEELGIRLVTDTPQKLDIGGVYVHKPAAVTSDNACMIKELVFDIDLTDYSRKCCTDKDMCELCFPLIKCAVEVLENILKNVFGFKHILFVFSGGRGVHCWVSDAVALTLSDKDRVNVTEYINSIQKRAHPGIEEILKKYRDIMSMDKDTSITDLYSELFPKLDVNVTKQTKHLLKSPFCIHPRSGRVCIPIDITEIDKLSLESVPTAESVVRNKSHLMPYIKYFQSYISQIQ
ncbi:DNA primase small subunit [Nematocida parisii]|uniref:DNA primase small subunit n=1 Tax=Nematocida parisii (strain ERTm3) TaxID=935791 RepID=I3EH85_NEMP3|nr:hypothetical protein NEQG_01272 [Nematocida parisii ERTm3]KAI5129926.1 DNA primase small subunit [Nematocida parisii]KAI5130132.1 DNA primase small subunit [Nematocida parisii]KAI5145358.1 DNA primase small subunit [Nematocida parisii]KAI5157834.1 DNA primase small subunit [Nematocida parisii]